jgi:hypothetical protein
METPKKGQSDALAVPGSALAAPLPPASELTFRTYWIGALPGLPVEHADIGGIHFPKLQEHVIRTPDGDTRRVPKIGSLVKLTRDDIAFLAERLPRTIVRFAGSEQDAEAVARPQGSGIDSVVGEQSRRRRGLLITVPTPKEIAQRRAAGLPTHAYHREPLDEPVANYLFAAEVQDQDHPSRGEYYPEPLSKTGIRWSEK